MVSKDQAIGGLILVVCVVIILAYLIGLFGADWVATTFTGSVDSAAGIRYWLAEIPVLVAVVAVLGIGAWIGYTMATTPPPKPIEEIEAEEKKAEEKAEEKPKAEEKKK